MPTFEPPLRGDGQGNYRIHLVGNSGTGKSTLGAYLSAMLNVPHVPLDEIAWQPGWQRIRDDEFKEKVSASIEAQSDRGWIIDGDYRELGTMIPDNATDIIWLDPPLRHYLPRLLWRTLMRLLGVRAPCAQGCADTWGEVLSSKGIVWFCITNHAVARIKYRAWLARMGVGAGVGVGRKMVRLDESRGELDLWKASLAGHLRRA